MLCLVDISGRLLFFLKGNEGGVDLEERGHGGGAERRWGRG